MLTLARVGVEVLTRGTEKVLLADAGATLGVPHVKTAVGTSCFLPGKTGEALTRARIGQEGLSLVTGRRRQGALALARTPVVLEFYASAIWGGVNVHHDLMGLQTGPLGAASRPQAVKA